MMFIRRFWFLFTLLLFVAPLHAEEKFIEANGLKIHYLEEGNGPPLLLIHGGGLSSKSWQASSFAQEASRYFTVIMPDSRGHGLTDNPSGQFSYPLMAEDMAALIKVLNLDKPLVMGYSDGGIITMTLALRHPHKVRAVVIGGATHTMGNAKYFDGMKLFYGDVSRGKISEKELDKISPEQIAFYQKLHHPENPGYWRTFVRQIWPMWTTPFQYTRKELERIKVPALVLAGDRDEFFAVEDIVALYRALPQGELAVIPGVGHAIFRTPGKTPLFTESALEFLRRQVSEDAASR